MAIAQLTRNGLSPPARGSLARASFPASSTRSIPARAGEPPLIALADYPNGVYPRPRGGARARHHREGTPEGLSPPARGSRACSRAAANKLGSIPARAGEPRPQSLGGPGGQVYPRPRGGAAHGFTWGGQGPGLSPPARGSLLVPLVQEVVSWSIPARAGEPRPDHSPASAAAVYPRPRGGASLFGIQSEIRCLVDPDYSWPGLAKL